MQEFYVKMQLTTEQRVLVVKQYHETKSYTAVRESFRQKFPGKNPPAKRTIQKNVEKYDRYGTSLNLKKGHS